MEGNLELFYLKRHRAHYTQLDTLEHFVWRLGVMTTNHKLCEDRCNAHLAEWHSLCTQQDITKYVLNESKQNGFPNRKNIFGKHGAMTMWLADLQLEDSNWPRAPTAKLWNLSLYLGQGHSSCGWLPAVADHAGIPKAGSFLGKRRYFWWLAGWLKGFPKAAQPFWDCIDFQDTSNFSSLFFSFIWRQSCMAIWWLCHSWPAPSPLSFLCSLNKILTWLILSWWLLLGGLSLT